MGNQSLGNYNVISKLGKGHFGKTRLCETPDRYVYSIKILQARPEILIDKTMNDINKFLSLQKSGSLKFREVFAIDSRCFGVVSEYCSQGNLRQHLIKKKELSQTLLEMKQIAQHLSLMHQSKLSHGNLKPNNILVRQGMLILSDMILPSFKKSLRLRDVPGAYDYYPREFFNDEMSNASDVWSLGIIFLEMYYGHSIRFLQNLESIQKPSLIRETYPSLTLFSSIASKELQTLLSLMLKPEPMERVQIEEVIQRLDEMSGKQIKTLRLLALNKAEKNDQFANEQNKTTQHLSINFDYQHPNIRSFTVNDGMVKRVDEGRTRLQVVSRDKTPLGLWIISLKILNYGEGNEEIAVGFTSQERKMERMSGDIDQNNSLAYWSNVRNKTGNLCLNGQWIDDPLPCVEAYTDVLQIVCDTINRSIEWRINYKVVRQSRMPRSYWDQSLYFFVGLMGKNCAVQLLHQGTY